MSALSRLAFWLHTAVETPAAISFLWAPHRQVPAALVSAPAPSSTSSSTATTAAEVVLVLHSYGALLASSVLISLAFALRDGQRAAADSTIQGIVALALATYHIWPCRRAYVRLQSGMMGSTGAPAHVLGGPPVHLAVHTACLALLLMAGLDDLFRGKG